MQFIKQRKKRWKESWKTMTTNIANLQQFESSRQSTGRKIRYLTPILHLSIPDMCSMNAEKHTLFIYISGTYWVFLHIVHILYIYHIYPICV
jgi:hypothetical protein